MGAQANQKNEYKEYVDRDRFLGMMRDWLDAMEGNRELRVNLRGQDITIAPSAWEGSRMEIEYEEAGGEYEFEMTLKWRTGQDQGQPA